MLDLSFYQKPSKFKFSFKKFYVGLTILLTGVATPTFAAYPIRSLQPNLLPERSFNFSFEALHLKPSLLRTDYALTYPSQTFTDGVYHNCTFHEHWGYRASIGSSLSQPGSNVMLTYTYFRDTARSHAVPNAQGRLLSTLTSIGNVTQTTIPIYIEDVTLVLFGELLYPDQVPALVIPATNIFSKLSVTSATTQTRLRQNALDLDFGQWISTCNFRLRLFGGLRYGSLNRRSETHYSAAGTSSTTLTGTVQFPGFGNEAPAATNVDVSVVVNLAAALTEDIHKESDFKGIGPHFGMEAHYEFESSGLSLVGSASTALIVGRMDNKSNSRTTTDSTETVSATSITITTVPGLGPLVTGATLNVAPGDVIEPPTTQTTIKEIKEDMPHVVPNIDARLGVSYTITFSNCSHSALTLEAGYSVTHYWNAPQLFSAVGTTHTELRTQNLDVSVAGPYAKIQFQA
jgi:hypothetical protein